MTKKVDESKELFSVRNALYLGNYGLALSAAAELKLKDTQLQVERDVLLYRAHIGLKQYDLVLSEIKDKDAPFPIKVYHE